MLFEEAVKLYSKAIAKTEFIFNEPSSTGSYETPRKWKLCNCNDS